MLSRRALVGRLAAGAAMAVAWAAGGTKPSAAAMRNLAKTPSGTGAGSGNLGPQGAEAEKHVLVPEMANASLAETTNANALSPTSAPPPWELLRPLRAGSPVGHGWRVAALSGVQDGVCVLTLRNARGRTHRVHLCRNDGRPRGLVYTKRLDMVVMNGGRGDLPTDEGLAQAVAKVAHVLAANEGPRQHGRMVDALLPHAQRLRLYAAAGDARLR